jgi:UDP-N-acetylglucosamine 2-epimerase (non-hydrolysing)
MKKIAILVGTRPNFIKVTRFKELAERFQVEISIIHTGQHFDDKMANIFFDQFELRPDHFLNIAPASPNEQIAEIMVSLQALFEKEGKPDLFIVPGDVNSTLAGAICSNKLGIKLAHLESGLRSGDRGMPEEHNRVLTDHLSDMCFVTEPSGLENIAAEKIKAETFYVGNTMIDTMVKFEDKIEESTILSDLNLDKSSYCLMTFHRPSNVDGDQGLKFLRDLIQMTSEKMDIVLPLHPRTEKMLMQYGLFDSIKSISNIHLLGPQGYFEFQQLVKYAKLILTDSGGIQEESTFRQVPCLTLRPNTERPITITEGSNTLLDFELTTINSYIDKIISGTYKKGTVPHLWDGDATVRILESITESI